MKKIRPKMKARVLTRLYIDFQMLNGSNSAVGGGIPPKSELIQAFMAFTSMNEPYSIKNEGARVLTSL